MNIQSFSEGIQLLGKVVYSINKLNKFSIIENVTFFFINCNDKRYIEILEKLPFTKNIVTTGETVVTNELKHINISNSLFKENREEIYKLTMKILLIFCQLVRIIIQ